ncbi:MAG: hypothetical protein IPF99_40910 [Deltaproteobacteria bacterium]|nr:hypothetical protein [Deltaproteobacteria bacterium]
MEADEIVGEVAWMLTGGAVRLGGPARLGATRLDIDIVRGAQEPAATGEARWEAPLRPHVAELTLGDLDLRAPSELGALHARARSPHQRLVPARGWRGCALARRRDPWPPRPVPGTSRRTPSRQVGVGLGQVSAVSAHARGPLASTSAR